MPSHPARFRLKRYSYEAVHPVRSLSELKHRLGRGRRCFAFFHPCLPGEPLVFVHVALLPEVTGSMEDVRRGTSGGGNGGSGGSSGGSGGDSGGGSGCSSNGVGGDEEGGDTCKEEEVNEEALFLLRCFFTVARNAVRSTPARQCGWGGLPQHACNLLRVGD